MAFEGRDNSIEEWIIDKSSTGSKAQNSSSGRLSKEEMKSQIKSLNNEK